RVAQFGGPVAAGDRGRTAERTDTGVDVIGIAQAPGAGAAAERQAAGHGADDVDAVDAGRAAARSGQIAGGVDVGEGRGPHRRDGERAVVAGDPDAANGDLLAHVKAVRRRGRDRDRVTRFAGPTRAAGNRLRRAGVDDDRRRAGLRRRVDGDGAEIGLRERAAQVHRGARDADGGGV